METDASGSQCLAERRGVDDGVAGEGELAPVGGEDEAASLAEDDAVAGDVEGELFAGVDHVTGGCVDVDGRGTVGGERVPGA